MPRRMTGKHTSHPLPVILTPLSNVAYSSILILVLCAESKVWGIPDYALGLMHGVLLCNIAVGLCLAAKEGK